MRLRPNQTFPGYKLQQKGMALFITLIALIALSLAGIALVRSVDTSNVVAGNLAFRQGALHATDVGIETAYSTLGTIVTSSPDANYPSGCATGSCTYYALKQETVDSRGVPTVINWANVPSTTVNSSYSVKYVIDRTCTGTLPVTDLVGKCSTAGSSVTGSKKSGAPVFSTSELVYYRVTVQVTGPRSTTSFVQALFLR